MNSISDINHSFYINLESRTDRKATVEEELKIIGIQATRFNAIKLPNGALGCSMSHLKCIEIAKENDWDHVLIVEDDIQFLNPELFTNQLNKFLNLHTNWDVVLIAGNNVSTYENIDDTCVKVSKCQTTTGYIVKNHYYDKLINNIRDGISNLIREPTKPYLYAIDQNWFSLQKQDTWYLIIPLTVTQREDYSDIEKKTVNYSRVMTSLNKEFLTNRPKNIINYGKPPKHNKHILSNILTKPLISMNKINFSS
jgi:glycosyl transferase family 25